MNPSSSRTKSAFHQFHGCAGDGCLTPIETWPLHNMLRGGARTRLCASCLLLSHRAYYCCYCLLLVPDALPPASRSGDDADNQLQVAPPAPTITCQVCGDAVAHLACLHHPGCVSFVCPACSAASEGRPFTFGPPCGAPLDERGSKVILLAARLALALVQHSADTARAEAVRRARTAAEAKRKAQRAVAAAIELAAQEKPPPCRDGSVPPGVVVLALPAQPPRTRAPPASGNRQLDLGGGSRSSGGTRRVTGAPPAQQLTRHSHAMLPLPPPPPPPAQRQRFTRMPPPAQPRSDAMDGVAPPPAQQRRNSRSPPAQPRRHATPPPPAQQRRVAMAPPPAQHPQLHALPPLAALTIGPRRDVTQLARAATEAARYSLTSLFGFPEASCSRATPLFGDPGASSSRATPPTLQLFPDWAGSSSRAAPQTLQLFQDSDDEEM